MTPPSRVIVIGAGIVGLASAYHILRQRPGVEVLVVERLPGPGLGDTAKSAAAFRDMFSSRVNRELSQGSIAFYEQLEAAGGGIDFMKIGYLWLMTAHEVEAHRQVLAAMARAGVQFDTLDSGHLKARLPELELGDISQGIFGRNCGILKPLKLARYYEQEILRLKGRVRYRAAVTGFIRDRQGRITGIRLGGEEIPGTVVAAAGAWNGRLMALAGVAVPVAARKRQLFSVPARTAALAHLLSSTAFSPYPLLPFTILPGGVYLRPEKAAFTLGYANPDQGVGLEEPARAERQFFETRIRPQVEQYFPAFRGLTPAYAWAGHYDEHLPDSTPFVESLAGAIVVGGTSGSGVMKADSLGRSAAGRLLGHEVVELAHGMEFRVAELGLTPRLVPPEEFVI